MNFDEATEKAQTHAHIRGKVGWPWLAHDGILEALDNELCLYDKTRAQRVTEADAHRTGMCFLADFITDVHVWHRGHASRRPERNPNLQQEKIDYCERCDCGKCLFDSGWDTLPPTIIGYELAVEYWERIKKEPLIDIPEPPPLFPDAEKETWINFEKDDLNYYNIVVHPQALPRIDWERKYYGRCLSGFLDCYKMEIWDRWLACGENNGWRAKWVKNGDIWEFEEEKSGWKVRLLHEDGREELLPGVYYPGQKPDWRRKRNVEWNGILTTLRTWLEIDRQGHWGLPDRRERFVRWVDEIEHCLDGKGPEPTDDIDLSKEISPKEKEFIDKCIVEVCHQMACEILGFPDDRDAREPLVWKDDTEE